MEVPGVQSRPPIILQPFRFPCVMQLGRVGPQSLGNPGVMMSRGLLPLLLGLGLSVASAQARPLVFGDINATDDMSRLPSIDCPDAGGSDVARCSLARQSFGGLPVSRAIIALNPSGRARSLSIALDRKDYDLAYRMLAGRYGTPADKRGGYHWRGFDGDATLAIRPEGPSAIVTFDFPANGVIGTRHGSTLPAMLLSILAAALALVAGLIFGRRRRSRRSLPDPFRSDAQPTMRAVLERRMREGGDLQF